MSAGRTRWLAAAVVVALVAGALVWAAVGADRTGPAGTGDAGQPAALQEGGTVRFAANGEPAGFNINTSKDNATALQDVIGNVYPSVFRAQPDLSVRLDSELMEGAELTSEQPPTVTYRIRDDAVWSDGTPISDDDFAYLWRRSNGSDKGIDVASTTGYRDIERVTGSPDGKTVTVRFARPFADWRSLFANLLPSHYVERQRGGWNTGLDRRPERIPSGGPFRIAQHDRGQSLTLERNPRYWGRPAHLDRIVLRFLPDGMAQVDALRNDEVDVIYLANPQVDVATVVRALSGVTSELRVGLGFEQLTFNLAHPVLGDLAVREAIALAIDRRQLLERTVGQVADTVQVLGNRVWLVGQAAYEDHSGDYGRGDVAAAAARLEQAGWTEGAGGVRVRDGRKLLLRYTTTQGVEGREQAGELVKDQLARVGIELELDPVDPGLLFERLPEGGFDITAFAWVGTPFAVSGSRDIYVTGGLGNYGGFADPGVDALFQQATAELDLDRSAALANQIDRKLWEGLPSIPLYQRPTFLAWRETLRNVTENPTTEGPLWNAESWAFAVDAAP